MKQLLLITITLISLTSCVSEKEGSKISARAKKAVVVANAFNKRCTDTKSAFSHNCEELQHTLDSLDWIIDKIDSVIDSH